MTWNISCSGHHDLFCRHGYFPHKSPHSLSDIHEHHVMEVSTRKGDTSYLYSQRSTQSDRFVPALGRSWGGGAKVGFLPAGQRGETCLHGGPFNFSHPSSQPEPPDSPRIEREEQQMWVRNLFMQISIMFMKNGTHSLIRYKIPTALQ